MTEATSKGTSWFEPACSARFDVPEWGSEGSVFVWPGSATAGAIVSGAAREGWFSSSAASPKIASALAKSIHSQRSEKVRACRP